MVRAQGQVMANRFRTPLQRKHYDLILAQGRDTNSALYVNGERRRIGNYGASHRQAFWNGYDHEAGGHIPPSCGCRTSANWACFRAGQDFRQEQETEK